MNPYAIIAALVGSLLLFAAGAGTGAHFTALSYKASMAKQSAEAGALLDQLDRTAAAKDAAQAEASRNLEAEHANQLQAVSATAAAFRAELDQRVLDAERRQGGGCTMPPTPVTTSQPQTASSGSNDGRGSIDPESVSKVRDTLKKLQADVALCWSWAGQVGR